MDISTGLIIMFFAGITLGYSVGFIVARSIYRSPDWGGTGGGGATGI